MMIKFIKLNLIKILKGKKILFSKNPLSQNKCRDLIDVVPLMREI
jgi:hypothetical protein